MNWSRDKSIILSQICVVVFGVLLFALDLGGYWVARWLWSLWPGRPAPTGVFLTALYLCSVFGWVLLSQLMHLLCNLRQGNIFIAENTVLLRISSWCCFGAAAISLAGSFWFLSGVAVALAAGFMGLILRILKNVFQQAVAMQSDLNLTI